MGWKSWEDSINLIDREGRIISKPKRKSQGCNHRYVDYIRFGNSIYIKFILPFLFSSTRQYQLSTAYAIRKKERKEEKKITITVKKGGTSRTYIILVSVLVTSFLIWLCAYFLNYLNDSVTYTFIYSYNLKEIWRNDFSSSTRVRG